MRYSYLANAALVDHIVFARSGAPVMTNQNTYDNVNRLTGKSSALNFNYHYNAASQRTRVTLGDGSYWLYGYDALGQLTSANKYFSDGTPVAGQQFDYAFDSIGNRTGTQAGGDQNGANLRPAEKGKKKRKRGQARKGVKPGKLEKGSRKGKEKGVKPGKLKKRKGKRGQARKAEYGLDIGEKEEQNG